MGTDKLNHVDYRWYIVRTQPHREKMLAKLLEQHRTQTKNILEVYAPTHTTINVHRDGDEKQVPLFTGFVFVLATQSALVDFLKVHSLGNILQYERRMEENEKARLRTIPEEQMRLFKDFNENYADKVIVLERPYSDYAFNPKTNEPNEIVRVLDGPLAGREGYIARFRRDKRLVFQMRGLNPNNYLTISLPNVWDFHVVRLHNAEGDRLSIGTEKERAADLLIGILQACGYGEQTLTVFHEMMDRLSFKSSLVQLCQDLQKKGEQDLSRRLKQLSTKEAELLLNLVRYEKDNPGYTKTNWQKLILRPFLTPTPGIEMEEGKEESELKHTNFTEIIRKVEIVEQVYYPTRQQSDTQTTTYYAHIGILPAADGTAPSLHEGESEKGFVLFINWDIFLGEYFLTADKANEKLVSGGSNKEKLIDSFRNFAPTLYYILTDGNSKVKAIQGFKVGGEALNVMAMIATDMDSGKDELISTCIRVCKEINTTTHLAVWRRYLRTVWLHV